VSVGKNIRDQFAGTRTKVHHNVWLLGQDTPWPHNSETAQIQTISIETWTNIAGGCTFANSAISPGVKTAVFDDEGSISTTIQNGDTVTIYNAGTYNGDYAVSNVGTGSFDITKVFGASTTGDYSFWQYDNKITDCEFYNNTIYGNQETGIEVYDNPTEGKTSLIGLDIYNNVCANNGQLDDLPYGLQYNEIRLGNRSNPIVTGNDVKVYNNDFYNASSATPVALGQVSSTIVVSNVADFEATAPTYYYNNMQSVFAPLDSFRPANWFAGRFQGTVISEADFYGYTRTGVKSDMGFALGINEDSVGGFIASD
jgi:hypothetical protein